MSNLDDFTERIEAARIAYEDRLSREAESKAERDRLEAVQKERTAALLLAIPIEFRKRGVPSDGQFYIPETQVHRVSRKMPGLRGLLGGTFDHVETRETAPTLVYGWKIGPVVPIYESYTGMWSDAAPYDTGRRKTLVVLENGKLAMEVYDPRDQQSSVSASGRAVYEVDLLSPQARERELADFPVKEANPHMLEQRLTEWAAQKIQLSR